MRASKSRTKFKGTPLALFALLSLSTAVVLGYGNKPTSFFARESKTPALGMSEAQEAGHAGVRSAGTLPALLAPQTGPQFDLPRNVIAGAPDYSDAGAVCRCFIQQCRSDAIGGRPRCRYRGIWRGHRHF